MVDGDAFKCTSCLPRQAEGSRDEWKDLVRVESSSARNEKRADETEEANDKKTPARMMDSIYDDFSLSRTGPQTQASLFICNQLSGELRASGSSPSGELGQSGARSISL